jgi:choline monooxygenase
MPQSPHETASFMSIESASTLPAANYCCEKQFAQETSHLFRKSWQYVGALSETMEAPSVQPYDLHSIPVVITKDKQNHLNAFYNVCRHRGGPLCKQAARQRSLRCHYHGWTYGLDGRLGGTPKCESLAAFKHENFSLKSIQHTTWNGLIFLNPNVEASKFENDFAGLPARTCPIDFKDLRFFHRHSYKARCNWKVYVDNYLEGYHLNMVHPELAKILDGEQYQTVVGQNWSLQWSPLKQNDFGYGSAPGEAHYYFLFPNMMLNILPGRMQVNIVIPISVDQCEVVFDYYYFPTPEGNAPLQSNSDFEFSDLVQKQDIAICEDVQRGLQSGGYESGRYAPSEEQGLYHFHQMYRQWLAQV